MNPPLAASQLTSDLTLILMDVLNDKHIVANKVMYQAHQGQGTLKLINQDGLPIDPVDPSRLLEWRGRRESIPAPSGLAAVLPRAWASSLARGPAWICSCACCSRT